MNEHGDLAIKVGVSSCLLGERVRFDSGHKNNAYINGVLSDYFSFEAYCPEVAIGLGIPREPIRLVAEDAGVRCRGSRNPELDVTDALRESAEQQRPWHATLCGYILKKDSPSCGMERVKVYCNNAPRRDGVGVYAEVLQRNFPALPIEEEGRLQDLRLRENFVQRVFVYARWRQLRRDGLSAAALQGFHARHKYLLMSHDQAQVKTLGALLAGARADTLEAAAERYIQTAMAALKSIATRANHVNTLQHIQGYLKRDLDPGDKAELGELIAAYQRGEVPLIVPITLLRHHFRRHPKPYIAESTYMNPHPGELMLLNHI